MGRVRGEEGPAALRPPLGPRPLRPTRPRRLEVTGPVPLPAGPLRPRVELRGARVFELRATGIESSRTGVLELRGTRVELVRARV
ncbi:hypothetical protein [Actinomadura sp. BRA 177]|uniref:hypothetical protein n=1 Tax=Actinomadura sp. BRA 177 TaxID=2745202 RepID=UPI001595B09E|nr:hypothetical protein [Actinomadura sp. BRA 177]NVI86799.1 hypothetical protein [Actinomadura sp. BRA 177]